MIKALLFDVGGVFVAPTEGDWLLPPGYAAVLGEDFARKRLEDFRQAREKHLPLLPDAMRMDTDADECAQFVTYYDAALSDIGLRLSREALEELAHKQVYQDDRYVLFEDVLPFLTKWREQYKIGIVSDAPPSTRRILRDWGILDLVDFATFSCELGLLKPHAEIYQSTLRGLGAMPEESLYVDDYPSKMQGAANLGMQVAQVRRVMPSDYPKIPLWEGEVFRCFAEMDHYLQTQN